jgi:chemotaxis response regulator CheB
MDKLKVFISDDSVTIRKRLVTMALDLPGMEVVGQAENAPRSLAAIRQTQPDVVILDIRMPGGNGLEVLREVKKMNPAPKVIVFTNYAHAQYRKARKLARISFSTSPRRWTSSRKRWSRCTRVCGPMRAQAAKASLTTLRLIRLSQAEQAKVPYQA